jgi:hypothetical protein
MDDLSNEMGLFLQKTNIIRDYLVRGTRARGGGCGGIKEGRYRKRSWLEQRRGFDPPRVL